ncbi:2-succinyl-6-hydroxy-2,4-cyclohexadiene-1-carboxylate synthase [Sodalis ligni]|jgi:2-succinyl-6-hydroxy-2,4-cyclohexadiene-1-carboxylate synthase|uniref:2-succinyl-6-hydroxy-2,4-cyclohexadiene-1-carboxylate synthase n=1 Tax=Sodalis ligni TaxID=2697027 RepID=A0A4R1NHW9_9GAMM|nr:2-succinyl-6-hydroxy-2,4-cyclohexadiene-1-carboxylate synthase [Sodalis ligni]TCL07232.1 2-succinyl-6-hydroxy-2,4-cyclohexadiene-1-carboxylate synthase [Sodalis ligni]
MKWAVNRLRPGEAGRPWLVWLHGLLGSGDDWAPVLPYFDGWPMAAPDLPGHGASCSMSPEGFAEVTQGLAQTLASLDIERYILIGYSLGGRIALYHACRDRPAGLRGVFVEGAHPGLASPEARADRLRHDRAWAQRFAQQPLGQVLDDWYRQPVFADLSDAQRRELVALRRHNQGTAIASMLDATSLARQPDLLPSLQTLSLPFGYLCGERDAKFSTLARQGGLPCSLVPGAGHNAHRAEPAAFAAELLSLLAPLY